MTWVTLSRTERDVAYVLAQARQLTSRAAGLKNLAAGPRHPFALELDGVAGELVVCRVLNVWPDLDVGVRVGGPDGRLPDGRTFDAKTNRRDDGELMVWGHKTPHADLYVLAVGHYPGPYRVAGWAPAAALFQPARLRDYGRGPTYALPQSELRPVAELLGADPLDQSA